MQTAPPSTRRSGARSPLLPVFRQMGQFRRGYRRQRRSFRSPSRVWEAGHVTLFLLTGTSGSQGSVSRGVRTGRSLASTPRNIRSYFVAALAFHTCRSTAITVLRVLISEHLTLPAL